MDKIKAVLEKIFNDYRIIFWCNAIGEFRIEFDNIQISDVEKMSVDNNEFSIKYI